jgi:hypothetical protein
MVIGIPLLIALIGLLMFMLSVRPKIERLGEIMFFAGLLAFLLGGVEPLFKLFTRP